MNLFDATADSTAARLPLADGAFLLSGFALAREATLHRALAEVIAQAPLRHMVTPGGFACRSQ